MNLARFEWVLRIQLLSSQYIITNSHLVSSVLTWGSWNRTPYMTLLWHLSSKSYKISLTEFFSSIQFSCSVMSDSLQPHRPQHTRPPCPSPTPRACSNSCPLSRWCHPTTSSLSPSVFNLSQHQGLFQWVSSLHQVAKVLEFQLQHQSFQWIFRTDFL